MLDTLAPIVGLFGLIGFAGLAGIRNPADKTRPGAGVRLLGILGLAGLAGTPVPVPAFHALVAVADPHTPVVASDPLPLRATAARPPPSC